MTCLSEWHTGAEVRKRDNARKEVKVMAINDDADVNNCDRNRGGAQLVPRKRGPYKAGVIFDNILHDIIT